MENNGQSERKIRQLEEVLLIQDLFILDILNDNTLNQQELKKYIDRYNSLSISLSECGIE